MGLRTQKRISYRGINPSKKKEGIFFMGKRGPQPRTGGRPKKPLADKVLEGGVNKSRLTTVQLPQPVELKGTEMPPPHEFLGSAQKSGLELAAKNVYERPGLGCKNIIANIWSPSKIWSNTLCYDRLPVDSMRGSRLQSHSMAFLPNIQLPDACDCLPMFQARSANACGIKSTDSRPRQLFDGLQRQQSTG